MKSASDCFPRRDSVAINIALHPAPVVTRDIAGRGWKFLNGDRVEIKYIRVDFFEFLYDRGGEREREKRNDTF